MNKFNEVMSELTKTKESISNLENNSLKSEVLEDTLKNMKETFVTKEEFTTIINPLKIGTEEISKLDEKFVTAVDLDNKIQSSIQDLVRNEQLTSALEGMKGLINTKSLYQF